MSDKTLEAVAEIVYEAMGWLTSNIGASGQEVWDGRDDMARRILDLVRPTSGEPVAWAVALVFHDGSVEPLERARVVYTLEDAETVPGPTNITPLYAAPLARRALEGDDEA